MKKRPSSWDGMCVGGAAGGVSGGLVSALDLPWGQAILVAVTVGFVFGLVLSVLKGAIQTRMAKG